MSTVVEVLKCSTSARSSASPWPKSRPPRLRIECAGCGRRYVANYWPNAIRRLKHCMQCNPGRPFRDRAFAAAAGKIGREVQIKNGGIAGRRARTP